MNHKATRGLPYVHTWAPAGLPLGDPAPVLKLHKPTGVVTVPLAPVRAPAAVQGVSDGVQRVVLAEPAGDAAAGLTGEGGRAWLDLGALGRFPVRVLRFVDAVTLDLAAPLPHAVPVDAAGELHWNVWEAVVGAEQVGDATLRRVRWAVRWSEDRGANRAAQVRQAAGLLDIVPNPFDTSVTDDDVVAVAPPLARLLPPEQVSYAPQRRAALDRLVTWVRCGLPGKHTEDDVNGRQFATAHALLTAALVVQAHQLVGYDRDPGELVGAAKGEVKAALADLDWLDDGDGQVEGGETGVDADGDFYFALQPRGHMAPSPGSSPGRWPEPGFRRKSITEAK